MTTENPREETTSHDESAHSEGASATVRVTLVLTPLATLVIALLFGGPVTWKQYLASLLISFVLGLLADALTRWLRRLGSGGWLIALAFPALTWWVLRRLGLASARARVFPHRR